MIAAEPQGEGQPWVIQRQNKTYNENGDTETFVEGNWYFQGSKILMAPSLFDVVQSRLVSDTQSLRLTSLLTAVKAFDLDPDAANRRYFQEDDPLDSFNRLLQPCSLIRHQDGTYS